MSKKPMSLEEFAKANPGRKGGQKCWICTIPEAAALNAGREKGVTLPVLHEWLIKECGYQPDVATFHRVRGHFQRSGHMAMLTIVAK